MPVHARAQLTLQAPIGGRISPLGEAGVACQVPTGGWGAEPGDRFVRPPIDPDAVGRSVELRVAPTLGACPGSKQTITLIATARWPTFDLGSVTFFPDEGRLEAAGKGFLGVSVTWKAGTQQASDTCRNPVVEGRVERCSWGVGLGGSADPATMTFGWLPRGALADAGVMMFDASGRRTPASEFELAPARIVISRQIPPDATVDLATGQGEVPLVHPEAVSSAECSPLPCEMTNGKLMVRGTTRLVNSLEVRVRFKPHVFIQRKDGVDTQVSARLSVLHCPMSIVSGAPVRDNDEARVIVKLEGRCADDLPSVRFMHGDETLRVIRTYTEQDASYALLRLGDIDDDELTITAVRGEPEPIALAVAHAGTRSAPQVNATLELPGFPNLSFIPNNRWAVVHVSSAGEHQRFVLLPVEGVYNVSFDHSGRALIRALPNAAGLTGLRFGVRAEGLPGGLDAVDLAVARDPLQREMGQANIPAPIDVEPTVRPPLIEVLCGGGTHKLERLQPGITAHLPFSLRDTCRVVFHRERLSAEYGTQKLNFEVDIVRPDGTIRGDSRVSEVVTLRAGNEPRYAFIRGVTDPFDRLIVRVSYVADENHYIGASEVRTGAPAAQWSAVLGTGRLRLYGTTAIPTLLYRFGDRENSGVLSLSFGVISRLTWLDADGKEGFLGAEAGALVFFNQDPSEMGEPLTVVGAVVGLGVAVPIANRGALSQASINLHAWFEVQLSDVDKPSERYALIFGPSISIGNVGVNL